jgi:hypothetical protein
MDEFDKLLESGTTGVLMHGVMNDLGIIGSAARTLLERWDVLPGTARDQLLAMIHDSVDHGLEAVRFLVLAQPAAAEPA